MNERTLSGSLTITPGLDTVRPKCYSFFCEANISAGSGPYGMHIFLMSMIANELQLWQDTCTLINCLKILAIQKIFDCNMLTLFQAGGFTTYSRQRGGVSALYNINTWITPQKNNGKNHVDVTIITEV